LRKAILYVFVMFMATTAFASEPDNYCLDSYVNSEWANILSQSPDDDGVAKLFALRIGLCELVERKIIVINRATKIFEDERQKVIGEKIKAKHKGNQGA